MLMIAKDNKVRFLQILLKYEYEIVWEIYVSVLPNKNCCGWFWWIQMQPLAVAENFG